MQWNLPLPNAAWVLRLSTLGVFTCLGASLAFWTLHWPSTTVTALAPVAVAEQEVDERSAADPAVLAGLLGSPASHTEPDAGDAPLRLVGVLAHGNGFGAALIAANGQSAKSFRVGSLVQDGLVLQKVTRRQAMLANSMQGPVRQTLELPSATPQ